MSGGRNGPFVLITNSRRRPVALKETKGSTAKPQGENWDLWYSERFDKIQRIRRRQVWSPDSLTNQGWAGFERKAGGIRRRKRQHGRLPFKARYEWREKKSFPLFFCSFSHPGRSYPASHRPVCIQSWSLLAALWFSFAAPPIQRPTLEKKQKKTQKPRCTLSRAMKRSRWPPSAQETRAWLR